MGVYLMFNNLRIQRENHARLPTGGEGAATNRDDEIMETSSGARRGAEAIAPMSCPSVGLDTSGGGAVKRLCILDSHSTCLCAVDTAGRGVRLESMRIASAKVGGGIGPGVGQQPANNSPGRLGGPHFLNASIALSTSEAHLVTCVPISLPTSTRLVSSDPRFL